MTQPAFDRNPFMLMTNPEVVLAAVEKSERLGQLNRHLCRPLDRIVIPGGSPQGAESSLEVEAEEDESGEVEPAR
jgi:hypothetical protein